jgi:hypothetical protein
VEYLDDTNADNNQWACVACPPGCNCENYPSWSQTLPPLPGFWTVPPAFKPTKVEPVAPCPFPGDCPINNGINGTLCAANNRQDGVVCATCKPGHIRKSVLCEKCQQGEFGTRLGIVFAFFIILVLLLFLAKERIKKFHKKYKPVYRDAVMVVKILISFSQVQLSLPTIMPNLDYPKSYRTFMESFSFVNMDVVPLLGFNCVVPFPYTFTVLVAAVLPIAVIVVTFLLYLSALIGTNAKVKALSKESQHNLLLELWSIFDFDQSGTLDQQELEQLVKILSRKSKNTRKTTTKGIQTMMLDLGGNGNETTKHQFLEAAKISYDANNPAKPIQIILQADSTYLWILKHNLVTSYVGTAVQILLLFHAPISAKSFAYFDCRPIGMYKYMHKDYNIECNSPEYVQFLPVALVLMVGFAFGVPFIIGSYIFFYRKHLQSPAVVQRIGFLYPRYRPGTEAWDVFELLRKMILTGALILAPGFSRTALSILVSFCGVVLCF